MIKLQSNFDVDNAEDDSYWSIDLHDSVYV